MKKIFIGSALLSIFLLTITTLLSRSFRVNQVPNGSSASCQTCHVTPGGPRNDFGKLVESRFLTSPGASGNVQWSPLLASLDADNDGVTNGDELQDPFGSWTGGLPNPGNPSLVSEPGNSGSTPLTPLTVQFSGMTPHIGQKMEIAVFNRTKNSEAARRSITVSADSFEEMFNVVLTGNSYFVDFYADLNGNGSYDPPPADHAWRLSLDAAAGNDVLMFTHNTDFTDIDWKYLLNVNFSGMTPHLNQLLELRVENTVTMEEVGRKRIEFIANDQFSISIPGIEMGGSYRVDFYADLNGNGLYDSPPSDHAWRLDFINSTGDFDLDFSHSTNFTDIAWKYMVTLNLSAMANTLGREMRFRVLDDNTSDEKGRYILNEVTTGEFSIRIPNLDFNTSYNLDFFADVNDNGLYDPPPADEAWTVAFQTDRGNQAVNFEYNTNWVDIQWPNPTSAELVEFGKPASFGLEQNYPNPFNPSTTIGYSIASGSEVSLSVYNSVGELVGTLVDSYKEAGFYEVRFNAGNLASGIYFYRIAAGKFSETKKLILMK